MSILSKKIVLTGRTASGKTTLKSCLCKDWNLRPEVSYTTRAPRAGEVFGKDYYFVSKEQFEQMISEGQMLEYDNFNGNYYGTSLEEFNTCDIMIMTPEGVKHAERVRSLMFVVYVYAPQQIILDRLALRHNVKLKADMQIIHERINADNLQFTEFEKTKPYDVQIDMSYSLELVKQQLDKYRHQYK